MQSASFKINHLKAYFFFLFWIFFYNFLPPIFVTEFSKSEALTLSIITVILFSIGYYVAYDKKQSFVQLKINIENSYKFYYLYIIVGMLSIVIGNLFVPLFAIISAHFLIKLFHQKKILPALIIIFITFSILFNQFTRMYLMMVLLYLFLFFYLKTNKLYILQILFIGISSVLLMIVMLYQRVFGTIDINKIYNYLSSINPGDFLKLIDNYFVYEVYLKVLDFFPSKISFLYGTSLLKPFIFWVPRTIWENKPEELTTWIAKIVYLGSKPNGYSTGMTLTGEFYLNFGITGVIVFSLMTGYVLSKVINALLKNKNEYHLIMGLTIMIYFPHIVRGGISLSIITLALFAIFFTIFFKTSYLYKRIKL